jgi:hypothetical protein
MTTTVRIPWTWKGLNREMWNHVSSRAIERFGLPGERYTCKVGVEYMDYIFKDKNEAMMFALEHSGRIISEQQTTVEFVSKLL